MGTPHYAEAVLEGECAGERFTAKGKSVIDIGWKGVAKISEKKKDDPDDTAVGDISSLHEGDEIKIAQAGVKAGKTTPPKSYTEDTLLSAMEKAGSDETPDDSGGTGGDHFYPEAHHIEL